MVRTPGRRPRADARRNLERLLASADTMFRDHGTDVPLERIARAANVAIGTLYGHFPSRRALIAALLRERHEDLFALGDQLLASGQPDIAVAAWARAVVRHAATYRGLATQLVVSLDDEASELHDYCQRMTELTTQLTTAARAAGALLPDITAADVTTLINAAAWIQEHGTDQQAERLIHHTLDGFRTPAHRERPNHSGG